MTTLQETIDRYKSECKGAGVEPSKFILDVLDLYQKKNEGEIEDLHLYLAGNNKLITDTRLTDDDAELIYKTLKNNVLVKSLDLRYNNITDKGIGHLAQLIRESPALRSINLMCNDFRDEGAKLLAEALQMNPVLESLQINGNKIGRTGGMCFAQALQVNTGLQALDVGDTDLKIDSVVALATVLKFNSTLKALNVNRPLTSDNEAENTVHYGDMLKENQTLQELHLVKHDIRDFGATRLAEALMENESLQYLNLSCNRITRDGAKVFAKLLKQDSPLRVLDLSYNRLEDDGAIYLAKALEAYNTNLETLVLRYNNISGPGLCAIADAMKINSSLKKVYIWGNNLEESACIAFSELISSGRLEQKNTDVKPHIIDGESKLAELSHSTQRWYYWGPSYGDDALAELKVFAK